MKEYTEYCWNDYFLKLKANLHRWILLWFSLGLVRGNNILYDYLIQTSLNWIQTLSYLIPKYKFLIAYHIVSSTYSNLYGINKYYMWSLLLGKDLFDGTLDLLKEGVFCISFNHYSLNIISPDWDIFLKRLNIRL